MYEYVYKHVYVCMCVCTYGSQRSALGVIPWDSVHFVFRDNVSHRDLGFTQLGWQLANPMDPPVLGLQMSPSQPGFLYGCWGSNSGHNDCVVTLYQLSCLISATSYQFFNHLKALEI